MISSMRGSTFHFSYRMTAAKLSPARSYLTYSPTKIFPVPPSLTVRLLSPYMVHTLGVWMSDLLKCKTCGKENTRNMIYLLFRIKIRQTFLFDLVNLVIKFILAKTADFIRRLPRLSQPNHRHLLPNHS